MWPSYVQYASDQLLIRHAVFADETSERGPTIVPLDRPAYARRPQIQCVAKILQWLRWALRAWPGAMFAGWVDSDTWFYPRRMAAHLMAVLQTVPPGARVWGGLWQHWERASWDQGATPGNRSRLLRGFGFSYDSWHIMSRARQFGEENGLHARSATERRAMSFGMTQGAWTYFSTVAVSELLDWVLRRGARLLGLAAKLAYADSVLRRTKKNGCAMDGDLGIGWIGTQAFANVSLYAVAAHGMLETFARCQVTCVLATGDP